MSVLGWVAGTPCLLDGSMRGDRRTAVGLVRRPPVLAAARYPGRSNRQAVWTLSDGPGPTPTTARSGSPSIDTTTEAGVDVERVRAAQGDPVADAAKRCARPSPCAPSTARRTKTLPPRLSHIGRADAHAVGWRLRTVGRPDGRARPWCPVLALAGDRTSGRGLRARAPVATAGKDGR